MTSRIALAALLAFCAQPAFAQESARDQAKPQVQSARPVVQPKTGRKAKNIILFLADAGGVPVLHRPILLG